jgi:hypothetical protein
MLGLYAPGLGMGGGEAAVVVTPRVKIRLRARADTLLRLRGRADAVIRLRGNQDMAINQDFEFTRGEDVTLRIIVEPIPTDVTGFTVKWKMAAYEGGPAILTKDATVYDAAAGELRVSLPRADTVSLDADTYFHEARRTDAGANAVLLKGRVDLLLEKAA